MTARRDAWVSWSAIAEPGDPVAAWLVDTLGPERALAWVRTTAHNPVGASMELAPMAPGRQVDAVVKAASKWVARLDIADPGPHLERAHAVQARVVTRDDPQWPGGMDDLNSAAPFALWVRGAGGVSDLMADSVAVVGARASTAYGDHMTADLAAGLCDTGRTVVSGGAYGIDASAHRAALAAGGRTLAVMAGGVDRFYPAGNAELLEQVLDSGAVMSEVPPGFAPHRQRFLSRNRLIATAGVTVVVEAAVRSGALSTARHAAELMRPVAAVPGPVTSASSTGCHALIRDGIATLVTCATEVAELAGPLSVTVPDSSLTSPAASGAGDGPDFGSAHERAAYDVLGPRGATTERVARDAGLTLMEARVALGGLELAGLAGPEGPVWRKKSA